MHFWSAPTSNSSRWVWAILAALVLHAGLASLLYWFWTPPRPSPSSVEVQALWENETPELRNQEPSKSVSKADRPTEPDPIVPTPSAKLLDSPPDTLLMPVKAPPPVVPGTLTASAATSTPLGPRVATAASGAPGNGAAPQGNGSGDTGGGGDATGNGSSAPESLPVAPPGPPPNPPDELVAQAPAGAATVGEITWEVPAVVLKGILQRLQAARRLVSRELRGMGRGRVEVRFRLSPAGIPLEASVIESNDSGRLEPIALKLLSTGAPYPIPQARAEAHWTTTFAVLGNSAGTPGKVIRVRATGDDSCDPLVVFVPGSETAVAQLSLVTLRAKAVLGAVPSDQGGFTGTVVSFEGSEALRPCAEAKAKTLFSGLQATGFLKLPVVLEER